MFFTSSLLASIDIVFGIIYFFRVNETRRGAVTITKILKINSTPLGLLLLNQYFSFSSNLRPVPLAEKKKELVHASDSISPVRYVATVKNIGKIAIGSCEKTKVSDKIQSLFCKLSLLKYTVNYKIY